MAGRTAGGGFAGAVGLTSRDLEAMFARHATDLVAYFERRVRDPELSRELLGETFLTAFAARGSCEARNPRQRAAWLYGIAKHKLEHQLRSRARERCALRRLGTLQALTAPEYERIEQLAANRELQARAEQALARLSDEQHRAIRARVLEERSYREVASDLGISEQAARARVSRGMAVLRRAIRPLRADTR